MSKNYTLPIYGDYINLVNRLFDSNMDWEEIKYAGKTSESELEDFLLVYSDINRIEKITIDDWKNIVALVREKKSEIMNASFNEKISMVTDESADNNCFSPKNKETSWQLYKQHLLEQGFQEKVVNTIEHNTERVLKRLSQDTVDKEPIRGMVIGNVQSGKTANMAGLMAMAADWGWNMFIVLSGTIENLRKQTQTRLLKDLKNNAGTLSWQGFEKLSRNCDDTKRTTYLNLQEDSHDRFFTVCLKNASRLSNLIQWLQADKNKMKQLKILVIDDEADQAGICTKRIVSPEEEQERNRINGLIVNLVNNNNENGEKVENQYKAMNYIGYTATPYANILNESRLESIYPKNFITSLGVSNEYFGPQQIFGAEGMDYDGLDIVRTIEENELEDIKEIHEGSSEIITQSMKDAICWFICGTAAMRYWGYDKPISMLVHTSQKQDHHKNISDALMGWLQKTEIKKIVKLCKKIWERETNRFSIEHFCTQYPDYGIDKNEINKYPTFYEIEEEIKLLLSNISNIALGEDGELSYHDGIHVCVDNCSNNGVNEDGMYLRLAYPEEKNMPSKAPAFIVIGGATLSRGLTIEGLISTVFIRTVGQADTLMQMGRWFGYRKGYELIPRIWLTNRTYRQFLFLSTLDQTLREEIYRMDMAGISPSKYGPKVDNTPMYKFIRITANNRMQSAQETDVDFSGAKLQTILFDDDEKIQLENIRVTNEFFKELGNDFEYSSISKKTKSKIVWKNIEFKKIEKFLREFQFCPNMRIYNDVDSLLKWIEEMDSNGDLQNWNVILSGPSEGKKWETPVATTHMISRTRRDKGTNNYIDIGVLRTLIDLVADVDISKLDEEDLQKIKNFRSTDEYEIREKAGLENVPQLIIYCIDKDSKVKKQTEIKKDLNAKSDLIGVFINLPGQKPSGNAAKKLQIKLVDNIDINDEDLQDEEVEEVIF